MLDKTVGFPGIHGAGVAGTHGEPNIIEQAPKGIMLNIGTLSMIVPIGILLHKHGEGVALNAEGQEPHVHMHMAPVVAIKAISTCQNYNINLDKSAFWTNAPTFSSTYLLSITYFVFVG